MNSTFAPPIAPSRAVPTKALSARSVVKFALLSEDITLQLTIRQMIEDLPQKCILESYLKSEQAVPFLDLAPPAVLLMDICPAGDRGSDCLRKLRPRHPNLPIVMVAERCAPEEIVEALRDGASGYLITPVTPQQLVYCLRAADRGWPCLCQQSQEILVDWLLGKDHSCWHDLLSPSEKQLVPFLFGTLPDRQIARVLELPSGAVDQVLAQLLKKLMAHNRREAVTNLLRFDQRHGRRLHLTTSLALTK